MSEWISVEDRLPDKHEEVIFAIIRPGILFPYRFGWLDHNGDFFCLLRGERHDIDNVPYWQSLPDPPVEIT